MERYFEIAMVEPGARKLAHHLETHALIPKRARKR